MFSTITFPFHRGALLAAALLGAGSSWASGVVAGTRFGAVVNAGGLQQGGAYQAGAAASYTQPGGNAYALASGSSEAFALHAMAWTTENPTLPGYCTVYTCTWQTYATVTVWDTITLFAPEGSTQSDDLDFTFKIDGTKTRGRWAYGDGAYASASYYFGTSPTGWNAPPAMQLSSGDTIVQSQFRANPGDAGFTVYLMAELSVSARSGSVADYSNTMALYMDLPQGWTYTSASGRFSPNPLPVTTVPEPASLALMATGLCGIAVRRRRARRAG